MKSEFRKCQNFISQHTELNTAEAANYVKGFYDDIEGENYPHDYHFESFIQNHFEFESDYGNGKYAISLTVYAEFGIGPLWESESVVMPRGCDSPKLKSSINNQFYFCEEDHPIENW